MLSPKPLHRKGCSKYSLLHIKSYGVTNFQSQVSGKYVLLAGRGLSVLSTSNIELIVVVVVKVVVATGLLVVPKVVGAKATAEGNISGILAYTGPDTKIKHFSLLINK